MEENDVDEIYRTQVIGEFRSRVFAISVNSFFSAENATKLTNPSRNPTANKIPFPLNDTLRISLPISRLAIKP